MKKFLSARISFRAPWSEAYDQGGLLLQPRRRNPTAASSSSPVPAPPSRWVKTGVEFFEGAPYLSTVTCDRFADWGLYPLEAGAGLAVDADTGDSGVPVTLEVVRDGDGRGRNAWVYRLVPGNGPAGESSSSSSTSAPRRVPLRKICWLFADEDEGAAGADDEWLLDVSPLLARPAKGAPGALRVEFVDFEVVWAA